MEATIYSLLDGNYVSYDESIQSTINGVVDISCRCRNLNEVFTLIAAYYALYLQPASRLGAHEVMNRF